VHDLRHHRERPDRARADARRQQQVGKVDRSALGRSGERAMQPSREDVARSHVVMRRHDEVRQQSLCRRFVRQRRQFGHDAIRTQIVQKVELLCAGVLSPSVRQVYTISPCARPSIALCGSSTKLFRFSECVGGTINVVGHGGINVLGGTDFDRRVVNGIVRPWLMEQFDLPEDLQKDPTYQRVLRIAGFYAEKAKIELSAQSSTRISADESQISARDRVGKEIYLDIPFDRPQLEELVFDQVERSIDACRKLLKENGYQPGDIDRIVFIGGPTRMPIVRSRVTEQLGIQGDLDSDPMTAVAFGAAIFAESP
jgi:Hsp70 protein